MNSKISIQNTNNYNISFQDNYSTIFSKYMLIINEFLKHYHDNIYIQNQIYSNYIIIRGILAINRIFSILLLYTRNLDIVYHNCQKAYIYYIEFMGQIGEDNHSFLQLNSKDATLFIYKKTIFDINNDIRKDYVPNELSTLLINRVDIFILIYNTTLFRLINTTDLINIIKLVNNNLQKLMQKIVKLYIDYTNHNQLLAVLSFITHFNKNNELLISNNILEYLDIFIKKIKKKKNININILEHLLINNNINNINNTNNTNIIPLKYINSLICQL